MADDLKLTRYLVVSDLLKVTATGRVYRVVFSTRSGRLLVVDGWFWQLVEEAASSAGIGQLPTERLQQLLEARIVVPAEEDEMTAVVRENLAAIDSDDVLYEVVQPTAWCQLDCHYCGQEHSGQQLSEKHQDELLGRLRARLAAGRYRQLHIGWFGAEPLAGLEPMRALSPRLQALAQEFRCGYSAKIVTNGLAMTPEVAVELERVHRVNKVEITLDGLESDHDGRRHTKGGKGSFRRIFDNLLAAAPLTSFELTVRCNVDRFNADGVAPLIRELADRGLARRIGFYTFPVYSWGNDAHTRSLPREEYAARELEWFALQLQLGFRAGLIPARRKIVCMSVKREAEVVDAFGETYNCSEAPYVPAYGQPNLYSIRLPSGKGAEKPVSRAQAPLELRHFNSNILSGKQEQCADCTMLPVCGGACPKSWQEGHPPCPSAKINISARLNILFASRQAHA